MKRIAVCGSDAGLSRRAEEIAEIVGRGIAKRNAVLVCGGRGGVMEAASRGAKGANGLTVGIIPGERSSEANPFVDIALPTSLGKMRNFLVVRAADAVIGIAGRWGTLSEISMALNLAIPVVIIQGTGGVSDWLSTKPIEFDGVGYSVASEHAITPMKTEFIRN